MSRRSCVSRTASWAAARPTSGPSQRPIRSAGTARRCMLALVGTTENDEEYRGSLRYSSSTVNSPDRSRGAPRVAGCEARLSLERVAGRLVHQGIAEGLVGERVPGGLVGQGVPEGLAGERVAERLVRQGIP